MAGRKANGCKARVGTAGVGSPSHVAGVLMEQLVGVKWQMISYRSAGLATQDLLAGITDIQLDTPAVSLTHVRSGDLKARQGAYCGRAGYSDHRRSGTVGILFFFLARHVGAERHAETDRYEAQRRDRRRP